MQECMSNQLILLYVCGIKWRNKIAVGVILFNPHTIDKDLGMSFVMTVERSNWGNIRLCQLRLEENHRYN
jgi:hypothetical protein